MNKLSAALPIAHVVLRILIVLNWLGGAAILALLVVMPNEQWIMAAFKIPPSPDADRLVMGLREPPRPHPRTEPGDAGVPYGVDRQLVHRPVLRLGVAAARRQQAQEVALA